MGRWIESLATVGLGYLLPFRDTSTTAIGQSASRLCLPLSRGMNAV